MRLSKKKLPGALSFNITPMIDIVFLLIIFFMTVSQITRTVDTPLPLPRVTMGDQKKVTATIAINLTKDGRIIVGGKGKSLEQLILRMESELNSNGSDPSKIKVQLRVHRECLSRHVTEVLQELAKLGFTNVRSAVAE